MFGISSSPLMKIPPFVLGATLLFWGWQTDFIIPGVLMALVLEGSRYLKLRWDLGDDDFKRIWTFCALLFLAASVYAFADNGGPEGFGGFFRGPNIASERAAGSASARTAAALIRWLPMIFFLFLTAQAFSIRQEIPLHTISLILQRRWKQARKLGRPLPAAQGVDVSYPFFAICLFASSVHKNQNDNFFWGLCVLLTWVLWVRRPRRFGIAIWMAALLLAISFGYTGARGVSYIQRYVENLNVQLASRFLGRSRTDPSKNETKIGEIGRVETSPQIVIWLHPKSGEFPSYLREASYRTYRTGTWFANRSRSDFIDLTHAATNENTWPLGLNKNASRVSIACYLTDRNPVTHNPLGVLPLPSGSGRLENFLAYTVQKNTTGAVLVEGPGLVQFDAIYGPGRTIDTPPETNAMAYLNSDYSARGRRMLSGTNSELIFGPRGARVPTLVVPGMTLESTNPIPSRDTIIDEMNAWLMFDTNAQFRISDGGERRWRGMSLASQNNNWRTDLQVPTNEVPALDAVIKEMGLAGKSRQDVLDTIETFFSTKFTYRMWQDDDGLDSPTNTALSRFLLKSRAGHCEYFATATVLILRELGIPARYAVGYSVHEAAWSGYVVRQSDSHAWCLVWDDEKNIWRDFDTTPGTGLEDHHSRASIWFANAWWWMHFQFSQLRWGQTHLRNYILIGLVPVLLLLLIQIMRQRHRRAGKSAGQRRSIVWPGLDSEFYQIERQLTARGLVRGANETLADWLERAAREPSLTPLKGPLDALLRLHYRYRFDPQGLSDTDRDELRREARACLDKLAQLEKAVPA
jgi:hypothetical protein